MSIHPITIVGAGLAGLTLGRCLRQHGLTAVVLERLSSSPRYNYGVTLHSWAFQPLLSVLQVDESSFKEKLAIDSTRRGIGQAAGVKLAPGIETDAGTFRCHRGRLEKFLQEGQDIRWAHTVQDVKASSESIVVQLKDEKPFEAKILIAADGPHSQTRKSLVPSIELEVLPYVVFNGKRRILNTEYQELLALEMRNQTVIQCRHNDILLEISVNDYLPKEVDISYSYSRPASRQDQIHKPDRDIPMATDIPQEFYQELGELKELSQAFSTIFDPKMVRRDRVLHWLMRSTLGNPEELKNLADRGVLLIGDAVHAMPILGGEGANNAMRDGVELAHHIAQHGTENLQAFTDARYNAWKEGVSESKKKLEEMHGMAKAS